MSEAKSFNCPNCGSPLMPDGPAKQVKCAFCGSAIIVPEELRDQNEHKAKMRIDDKDPFLLGPRHLQWLIQNGADATVKVDSVKDKGKTIVIYWSGTKAAGGVFKNHAEIEKQRLASIPRHGETVKIKYNPEDTNELDFAFQIDGQFYWDTTLWDHWSLE